MKLDKLEDFETVREWLDIINPRPNTKRNYLVALYKYSTFTELSPDELIEQADEEVQKGVLPRNRKIKKHLISFRKHLIDSGLSPNTRHNHFTGIRSFYKSFDHEIPRIGKDEKAQPKPEHLDIPTKDDIRETLLACDLRNKAIILAGCSSGLGAAEIIDIPLIDFKRGYDEKTGITTLFIRRGKSQTDHVTFFSPEASRAIWEYLDYRNRDININDKLRKNQLAKQRIYDDKGYLFIKKMIPDEYLETRDEELRKFDQRGLLKAYRIMSDKAGKTTDSGVWNLIRSHNMRKFFNSTLKNAGFDSEKVEFLMGHSLGGTRGAYYRAEAEKLKEIYIQFIPYLTIQKELDISESPEYQAIKNENAILQRETARHVVERSELADLKHENEDIKAKLNDMESLIESGINEKLEAMFKNKSKE